jgi:hypothetical protein
VRAPIILATVKLLTNLPTWVMEQNLDGSVRHLAFVYSLFYISSFRLVVSMNHLLLSRSISVRQGARKVMGQLLQVLGPSYLSFVIKEFKQTMSKGYQVR